MSELTLGEIAQIVDCEHKTAPATLDEPFGYSVGTRALNGHGINLSECKPVSEETYNAWSRRAELVRGDIVFAREAPVGGLGLVDGTVPLCLGQRTVLVRPRPSLVDSRYLYYLLRSEECQRQMIEMSTGSTVLHINVADVRNFKLNEIPTLEIQCAIGEILSEIEEKIKVNQQIASTLEQIAQTIFKSWFVDFDPVHAKARGEQPIGMDAETASLFPNSFEDSELGSMPSGWQLSRIDEVSKVMLGGTPSKSKPEYWDGDVAWINSGAVNDFRIIKPSTFITKLGHDKSSTKILRPGTTVLAITGATLGRYSRVEILTTANQSVIGLEALDADADEYIFLWISNYISELVSKATGGAQQHINRNDVCEHIMLTPNAPVLKKFSIAMKPIFDQISSLLFQSETLSEIRDSLLPRLISGELEIPAELLEA